MNRNELDVFNRVYENWQNDELLNDFDDKQEKIVVANILENVKLAHALNTASPGITLDQTLWITKEAWRRLKLRKMINVCPMIGPTALIPVFDQSSNLLYAEVAAKTTATGVVLYPEADFDGVKNVYADSLSKIIDHQIFLKLPKIEMDFEYSSIFGRWKDAFDYLVVPSSVAEKIKTQPEFEGVDIIGGNYMSEDDFGMAQVGGKYPNSCFAGPILCPYVMFHSSQLSLTAFFPKIIIRFGWASHEKE